jgi:hypothetical protein
MLSDPHRAIERLLELARSGVTHLVLAAPGDSLAERCAEIERFAAEVLPVVRREVAKATGGSLNLSVVAVVGDPRSVPILSNLRKRHDRRGRAREWTNQAAGTRAWEVDRNRLIRIREPPSARCSERRGGAT